ncbi:hypothetical protein [Synechococcus sp. ATX 2A4]|uniref:hypothetical protein n=1 Tax=Synechococcus sp. ATX 2A4 TaxID=2823727 RepID=UPI0037DA4E40
MARLSQQSDQPLVQCWSLQETGHRIWSRASRIGSLARARIAGGRRQGVVVVAVLLLTLLPALLLPAPGPSAGAALAGPVSWKEVPATEEGRQWWDEGSLRLSRDGWLSVLSRFQPAPPPEADDSGNAIKAKARPGQLYVMDLDCGQRLYRDTAVNGLPRFGADWQPTGGDALITAVLEEACAAGAPLLASR